MATQRNEIADEQERSAAVAVLARAGVDVQPQQVESILWRTITAMLDTRRVASPQDLTPAEEDVLRRGGFTLEPVDLGVDDPLLRTATDYAALVATSLSVPQAAQKLGVNASRVRQRLKDGTLYGFKVDGDWRIPRFQFAHNRLLPGIAQVFPHLPRSMHPVAIYTWFTTPDVDLSIGATPISPQEWLRRGQPVDVVAAIAATL